MSMFQNKLIIFLSILLLLIPSSYSQFKQDTNTVLVNINSSLYETDTTKIDENLNVIKFYLDSVLVLEMEKYKGKVFIIHDLRNVDMVVSYYYFDNGGLLSKSSQYKEFGSRLEFYDENGFLRQIRSVNENNELDGWQIEFNEHGVIISREKYLNGQKLE